MSWAAEHPEPVYPQYLDWFLEQFGLERNVRFGDLIDALKQPIPADIAQKLGLEPKEG